MMELQKIEWEEGEQPVTLLEMYDGTAKSIKLKLPHAIIVFDFEDQEIWIEQGLGEIVCGSFLEFKEEDQVMYTMYWKMRDFYLKDLLYHRKQIQNELEFAFDECDSEGEFVERGLEFIRQGYGETNKDVLQALQKWYNGVGKEQLIDEIQEAIKLNLFTTTVEALGSGEFFEELDLKPAKVYQLNGVN